MKPKNRFKCTACNKQTKHREVRNYLVCENKKCKAISINARKFLEKKKVSILT